MRNSGNVGPKHLTGVFTFHSSPCSVILNAFFYFNKVKNKPISIFVRISKLPQNPLSFVKCQPGICTVHCQSSTCILSQRPLPTEGGGWGRRKGGKHLFCQFCVCCCHSLLSLAQFNQIMLVNLGWNSWRLLMSHFLEQLFWILPFKRAFAKSFTTEGDSVLC